MTIAEFHIEDVDHAIFALGRFIDYRLSEGMQEDWLFNYQQAYLNLLARRQGLEPPDLHELRARTTFDGPEDPAVVSRWSPAWLPYGEKLRLHRLSLDSCQSTPGPDELSTAEPVAPALVSS